jgi:galactokinase
VTTFAALFDRPPAVEAEAPGRVNLIGEHTDYNGGYVLPTAIPQRTRVELAPRADRTIRIWSANVPALERPATYVLGAEQRRHDWLDYVQGVSASLAAGDVLERGFDARIASDVPQGSGLSSSAALEIALLRALRAGFGLPLHDVEMALIGQRAENEFVGARVGIMDQMAASLADTRTALFLDTRDLSYERLPLPASADLAVIDSGVRHSLASGDYNTRRAECERACALLGVGSLRDLGEADLPRVALLPAPFAQRARHVITENARVLAAVVALRAGDAASLGHLFYASHASQRDDYAVSVPAVDLLVELARAEPDVYGARLTGGGFGGAIVLLTRAGRGAATAARIAAYFAERTGERATLLVPAPTAPPER